MNIHDTISSNPDVMSGAVVVKGTRVQIEAIFLNLKDISLDEVLEEFPTVSRAQAEALLDLAIQELKRYFPDGW